MGRYGNIIFLGIVALCIIILSPQVVEVIQDDTVRVQEETKNAGQTIVLDAGHGGFDPGKVGINDILEKDINLAITLKLKTLLEQNGYTVVLTRGDDVALYSEGDKNKKSSDMKNRVKIINDTNPVIAISIHQNSFEQESSKGAQVFYHKQSPQAKLLADTLQNTIKTTINDGNKRVAKDNESYYMLKNTVCPIVIVECGFLSNRQEANLLAQEAYQDQMAWAIHLGIISYLNQNDG